MFKLGTVPLSPLKFIEFLLPPLTCIFLLRPTILSCLMAEMKMGRSPTVPPAPPATFIPNGSSDFWMKEGGRGGGPGVGERRKENIVMCNNAYLPDTIVQGLYSGTSLCPGIFRNSSF